MLEKEYTDFYDLMREMKVGWQLRNVSVPKIQTEEMERWSLQRIRAYKIVFCK